MTCVDEGIRSSITEGTSKGSAVSLLSPSAVSVRVYRRRMQRAVSAPSAGWAGTENMAFCMARSLSSWSLPQISHGNILGEYFISLS